MPAVMQAETEFVAHPVGGPVTAANSAPIDLAAFGAIPTLAWLPVGKLTVDHLYQRTLESRASQRLIERIVGNFRWPAFQAVMVAPIDDGLYTILDGQHRVESARRLGLRSVPCVIVEAPDLEAQANAFVRANEDRVAVNIYALFNARVIAGDAEAIEVAAICGRSGVGITRYPIPADKMKPGQTLALGCIIQIYRGRGSEFLATVLSIIGPGCRHRIAQIRAPLLRAVAQMIRDTPAGGRDALSMDLAAYLRKTDPARTAALVAAERRAQPMSESAAIERVLWRAVGIDQPIAAAVGSQPLSMRLSKRDADFCAAWNSSQPNVDLVARFGQSFSVLAVKAQRLGLASRG